MRFLFLFGVMAAFAAACSGGDKAVNEACEEDSECSSDRCHRGVCADENPWRNNIPCSGPGNCRSAFCEEGICVQGEGELDSSCFYDEECLSNDCSAGRCSIASDAGAEAGAHDAGVDDADGNT